MVTPRAMQDAASCRTSLRVRDGHCARGEVRMAFHPLGGALAAMRSVDLAECDAQSRSRSESERSERNGVCMAAIAAEVWSGDNADGGWPRRWRNGRVMSRLLVTRRAVGFGGKPEDAPLSSDTTAVWVGRSDNGD